MPSVNKLNLEGGSIRDFDIPLMARPDVFCAVAKHEFFLKYLQALTGVPVEKVLSVEYEDTISLLPESPKVATVRLDVLINHTHGVIDIEIQRREEPNLVKRIRYYQAATTLAYCLEAGQGYQNLRQSIVVFLCYKASAFPDWRTTIMTTRYGADGEMSLALDGSKSCVYNLSANLPADCPDILVDMFTALRNTRFLDESCSELAEQVRTMLRKGEIEMDEKMKRFWREEGFEQGLEQGREIMLTLLGKLLLANPSLNSFSNAKKDCPLLTESEYIAVCKKYNLEPVWD